MNRKDLARIRRRFTPEKNDISVIRGCFVNENREIVSTFAKSPLSLPQSEAEHYLADFKKTLGGAPGRNQFAIPVRPDDPAGQLLRRLQVGELRDEKDAEALFRTIIDHLEMEGAYLILAMRDVFSVPKKKAPHTDAPEFTDEVFSYILVSVCPVKLTKPLLTFFSDDRDFHTVDPDLAVAGPALGFMYPMFLDGGADLSAAHFFTRDSEDLHADFIDGVFGAAAPASASDTRQTFYDVLNDSLETGLTFEVVQTLHENLTAQLADRKKDAAPLQVSRREIASLLQSCDVPESQLDAFQEQYLEQFGAVGIEAAAIAEEKRFEVETETVKISVDPGRSDLVTLRKIDGRTCIVVAAEGAVTVNGVEVSL